MVLKCLVSPTEFQDPLAAGTVAMARGFLEWGTSDFEAMAVDSAHHRQAQGQKDEASALPPLTPPRAKHNRMRYYESDIVNMASAPHILLLLSHKLGTHVRLVPESRRSFSSSSVQIHRLCGLRHDV